MFGENASALEKKWIYSIEPNRYSWIRRDEFWRYICIPKDPSRLEFHYVTKVVIVKTEYSESGLKLWSCGNKSLKKSSNRESINSREWNHHWNDERTCVRNKKPFNNRHFINKIFETDNLFQIPHLRWFYDRYFMLTKQNV